MFKYPDNIIVNWLRSKYQNKIDKLEKNYFSSSNEIVDQSVNINLVKNSDDSITTTTHDTTSAQSIVFKIIDDYSPYIGKKIVFYSKYTANDQTFNLPRFLTKIENVLTNYKYQSQRNQSSGEIYVAMELINVENSDNTLYLRFYGNATSVPINEITFSDITVKIID